jgi:hypothetical protein
MAEITVFVSHSWSSTDQYLNLVAQLHSISDLEWHNVSVVRNDPLKTEIKGEPVQQQELELQRSKLNKLRAELGRLESELNDHERKVVNWKRACEANERLRREIEEAEMFSKTAKYMTNLLERKHGKSIVELRASANAPLNKPKPQPELKGAEKRLDELKSRAKHCERRIEQLQADCGLGVHLINYRSADIFHQYMKLPEEAINEDRNLVLMLENQIDSADVVIVIAEMYAQYRKWMACEIGLAQSLNRPILAVVPPGQAWCPKELEWCSAAIVPWDSIAIGKALLSLSRELKSSQTNRA